MSWLKFGTRNQCLVTAFLLAMTFSNVALAVRLSGFLRDGYQNFTIFYAAARMVRGGQSSLLYDLPAESRAQEEFAPNVRIRQAALPYMHPPFEALLFLPFTFLRYVHAYLLWSVLNGGMVIASMILLRRQFVEVGGLPLAFVVLAATGFLPVVNGLIQGQDSSLLLLLFVVALAATARGNDILAGAALAAGLFKFNLILPLVFLLAVKRPRLLLGFAPVAALLGGVSLAMVGWQGVASYLHFLFHLEHTGAGGAIVGQDMPNVRGMIASLAGGQPGASLMPIAIACSAIVIGIAWWRLAAIDSVRFDFVLATTAAILVSYHTFSYDLSLLLPAVLLLFAAPGAGSTRPSGADVVLLVMLYLTSGFDILWPHVNQFCWPVVVLTWLFWKLGSGRPADSIASIESRASL